MMSARRQPSVKETRIFFEQLGQTTDVKLRRSNVPSPPYRTRPVSVAAVSSSLRPPQKPKRTFQHDLYANAKIFRQNKLCVLCASTSSSTMSSSLTSSPRLGRQIDLACSSDDSYEGSLEYNSDISSHPQKLCLPANLNTPSLNGDVHTYDVPVESSPIRRYRSTDDIYASPVINIRNEDLPRSHHDTLYYASTDVITSNPNKVELGKSMTPVSLRRTFGFKKKLKIEKKCPQSVISSNSQNNKEDSVTYLEQRVTRARLVRRRTLAQFDKQVAALCGSEPRLFEFVLLVELVEKSFSECGKPLLKPVTTFRFPEDKDEKEGSEPAELFFPDFSHMRRLSNDDHWPGDEEFVIALTDNAAFRKNAYCIKFLPDRSQNNGGVYPSVLVIISPIKNAVFYLDLARNSVNYAKKNKQSLTDFLGSVVHQKYPQKRGSSLVILERYPNGTQRRLEIRNHGTVLGKTGCALVIERLSPEITVCIVAALLGEQRVLLAGNTVCSTTKTVQVMEALLRPLCWPHTFIPAVPDNLFDLCHNPTPYLMGILRNNLAPIRELIVDDKDDIDKIQADFVFIDADTGLVNPRPIPFDNRTDIGTWRTLNAIVFCQRLGMPKKLCLSLIKGLRSAISCGCGPAADLKVENAMMSWYSSLFGHYRFVGCHLNWNDDARRRLVSGHPCKITRQYLSYLTETVTLDEWMAKRASKSVEPEDVIPGSEEALSCKIDEIWLANFQSITPKPIARMVTKVSNVLHLTPKKK